MSLESQVTVKKDRFPELNIPQFRPIYTQEMEDEAIAALRNGMYLRSESVFKFEEEFARYIGAKYAIAVNSGTDALTFILLALGSNGKRFLTTTWSFISSANSILHAGGVPLLGDASPVDYCLDPLSAESFLKNARASGIIPVHLYGQPFDYDAFHGLEEIYKTPIIEDACQAHGALYKGRKVGSLGLAASFSFYPTKNMSVLGDGGMVTTSNESIARIVSKLRDSGRVSHYEHDVIGFTSRMGTVQAAIGRVQLRHLDEWNRRRQEIAATYRKRLRGVEDIVLPPAPHFTVPIYHQFVIRSKVRDVLQSYLQEHGIQTGVHYPLPIHLQPLYREKFGYEMGILPQSESFSRQCLSLPMYPSLSDDEVGYIADSIVSFFQRR